MFSPPTMLRRSARIQARQIVLTIELTNTNTTPSSPPPSSPSYRGETASTTQEQVPTNKSSKRKRQLKNQNSTNTNTPSRIPEPVYQYPIPAYQVSPGSSTKKQRRPNKKPKLATPNPSKPESEEAHIIILASINRSDPCSKSAVSKTWPDGCRSSPIWKQICEIGGLEQPKLKYKTYTALAYVNSYWICEDCFSVSKGRPRTSHIPLPVTFADSDNAYQAGQFGETNESESSTNTNIWMLCHACRLAHFTENPEAPRTPPVNPDNLDFQQQEYFRRITKTAALLIYTLQPHDLNGLPF
ncbi:hypothetical protein BGZ47_011076 [Haplosporangium gracile]|nr:hypothetical protein BGZ47_011076 [Haplosporangium gracile]